MPRSLSSRITQPEVLLHPASKGWEVFVKMPPMADDPGDFDVRGERQFSFKELAKDHAQYLSYLLLGDSSMWDEY